MELIKKIINTLPSQKVYAHCDVPCGIYDARPMQIAAETVLKMVKILTDLKKEDAHSELEYLNTATRAISTKEEHAQKCKEELLVLWTDYFKVEHLEKFPNLHETFWNAAKLCSKNKQSVDLELAQQLVDATNEIAQIFADSKK